MDEKQVNFLRAQVRYNLRDLATQLQGVEFQPWSKVEDLIIDVVDVANHSKETVEKIEREFK